MGKMESILVAMSPLKEVFHENEITCHVREDHFDVLVRWPAVGNWEVLFHCDDNNELELFFLLRPSLACCTFVEGWQDLQKRFEMIAFSGKNVFRFLNIGYSSESKGPLAVLREISELIKVHSANILDASSEKNLERTYYALIAMENNEDELRQKVKQILFVYDL